MRRRLTRRQKERRLADEQRCLVDLLRHFHKLGYSLADCADRRRLDREPGELLKYARMAGLIFPDSVHVAEQRYVEIAERKRSPGDIPF
jgi:hypothetical protein